MEKMEGERKSMIKISRTNEDNFERLLDALEYIGDNLSMIEEHLSDLAELSKEIDGCIVHGTRCNAVCITGDVTAH